MICPKCGANLPEKAVYCPNCKTLFGEAKPKKPIYKKWWFWVLAVIIIIVVIVQSAGGNDSNAPASATASSGADVSSSETQTPDAADAEQVGSGTIDDYDVSIDSFALSEDYEGNPAIIVTYTWTNNSSETTSFAAALYSQVFQNGVECETAIILDDSNYNVDNYIKDVQPGTSLAVQMAFVLQDTTNPVEVNVSELFSLAANPPTVTQSYNIA